MLLMVLFKLLLKLQRMFSENSAAKDAVVAKVA